MIELVDGRHARIHRELPPDFPLGDLVVEVDGRLEKIFRHEITTHDGKRNGAAGSKVKPYVRVIPYRLACMAVNRIHRHHRAPQGHKFSIGLFDRGQLLGVAVVGRPVSRHLDDKKTLEVTRMATTGHPNACSTLYAAAAREARIRRFARLITYTLASEPGTSLVAAGFTDDGVRGGGSWSRPVASASTRRRSCSSAAGTATCRSGRCVRLHANFEGCFTELTAFARRHAGRTLQVEHRVDRRPGTDARLATDRGPRADPRASADFAEPVDCSPGADRDPLADDDVVA